MYITSSDCLVCFSADEDDIGLYAAGSLEITLPNSELGPTFSHMMAEQFQMIKDGDRFFFCNDQNNFEDGNHPHFVLY